MRPFVPGAIPTRFAKVFARPFTVTRYRFSPEYIRTDYFPDDTVHTREAVVHELGAQPKTLTLVNEFCRTPRHRVTTLRGPMLYHAVLHSRNGGFFPDSPRARNEDGSEYNFAVDGPISPRRLGKRHFVHVLPKTTCTYRHIDAPSMVFYGSNQFGHFLLESAHLLWALDVGFQPKLVLPGNREGAVPEYLRAFIEPYGLDNDVFTFAGDVTTFSELYVPTRAYMHNRYITNKARAVWHRISAFHAARQKTDLPKKIYVSRVLEKNRRLINEADCEAMFQDAGFTVIRPEDIPFSKQIALFANASHVAGTLGSALHMTIFSLNPDLRVLYLAPRKMPSFGCYCQIDRAFGRPSYVIWGDYLDKSENAGRNGPWQIDNRQVKKALKDWLAC